MRARGGARSAAAVLAPCGIAFFIRVGPHRHGLMPSRLFSPFAGSVPAHLARALRSLEPKAQRSGISMTERRSGIAYKFCDRQSDDSRGVAGSTSRIVRLTITKLVCY